MSSPTREQIEYIISRVPAAASNTVLLVLTYWKIFDGIDIPPTVAKEILAKATPASTITRTKRKLLQTFREANNQQ